MIEYTEGDFLTAPDDYLLCIASCTANRIDRREPLTSEIFGRFPEANIYKARSVDGSKGTPGSLIVRGKIAIILGTFYPGTKPYPNDSQDKRLNWFAQGLRRLCTQYKPNTIAIRERFCEESGGDWEAYLRVIDDLGRNLALSEQDPPTFRIYKYVQVIPLFSLVRYRDVEVETAAVSTPGEAVSASGEAVSVSVSGEAGDAVSPQALNEERPRNPIIETLTTKPNPPSLTDVPPTDLPKPIPRALPPKLPKLAVTPTAAIQAAVPVAAAPIQAQVAAASVTAAPVDAVPVVPVPVAHIVEPAQEVVREWDANPSWKAKLSQLPITGWDEIMSDATLVSELQRIEAFFEEKELPIFGNHISIFPPQELIFNAFNLCPLEQTRVVLVGQDPYHSKEGEAMGLSFSVPEGIKIPSSLQNIYKELVTDIPGWQKPETGDLSHWARQGVLLINTALTVRQGQPKSHLDIWRPFTDRVLTLLSKRKQGLVFILWGNFAKQKQNILKNVDEHCIITGVHPSGLSASRGFFGSKPFSQANEYLRSKGLPEIQW